MLAFSSSFTPTSSHRLQRRRSRTSTLSAHQMAHQSWALMSRTQTLRAELSSHGSFLHPTKACLCYDLLVEHGTENSPLGHGVLHCRVWFSSVVAKSATRTRCDFGGHKFSLQKWKAPLNGAVLGVRDRSKAFDAMLEHDGVRRLEPRATRNFLQVRKPTDEA